MRAEPVTTSSSAASTAMVATLKSLKLFGVAHAVAELAAQGAPAFDAAQPMLGQLLKAETAEREVRRAHPEVCLVVQRAVLRDHVEVGMMFYGQGDPLARL